MPHPVRLIGRLAAVVEAPCRSRIPNEKAAGVMVAAIVVSASTATALTLERAARRLDPRVGDLVSIGLIYTCLAARDLADHAERVQQRLRSQDLPGAREAVSRMVGRDTANLGVDGVVRAAVESVAENTTDGVVAPLFHAFVGGAPAVIAFKAPSTLDSIFGYKNARYLRFGWASARLDDLANYLPARLAVPCTVLAAAILRYSPRGAIAAVRRDAKKHASPNSGLAEAAFAGASGVRLEGPVCRAGRQVSAPFFGEPRRPLEINDIARAVSLMWATSGLATFFFVLPRWRAVPERFDQRLRSAG